MAKRRNRYPLTGLCPANIDSMEQSRLWHRLNDLSADAASDGQRAAIDHLKSSVRRVTKQATWISTQVCRFMPQYTLHEQRHFLNVLAIMDALIPADVIARFGPLDCVLPILAAYTHDLGMALSQEEYDRLQDESTEQGKHYASYGTRFDEELRQLERWKKRRDDLTGKTDAKSQQESVSSRKRIDAIEGHILASYLRDTHTEDDQVKRLRRWLDLIKQETGDDNLFRYGVGGMDFQRELALIGISHGRGALWLRRQLIDGGPDDRFFRPVATGESANLAFPGLLLRLADVMDFDASRAPRILFKHFGIENDKGVLEWDKHLSVVGWRLDVDPDGKQQPDLLYSAECQHPVHEKAIREFKTWIDAELSAVRVELDAQRRQLPAAARDRYDLHLPSQTRLDIRPVRDPLTDQPKYVYHDLQFRLDQDEIQQLLMGESLYGDPGLCIRELLQNALDALELRELRLKMKQKGEAREPVDGELIRPGWVREPDGREEELRVTLDWGTDEETGQQWLRVTDNGVGMTEEVIKKYFTQIGKSYYRSPEFNQERAAMKVVGEVVSPISIFGIGVLSSFMISERIIVRTRPMDANDAKRAPWDFTISGAGSLFWMQPGTLRNCGTEILLLLKSKFSVLHDDSRFDESIRRFLGYEDVNEHKREGFGRAHPQRASFRIDVPLTAQYTALWPRYPIDTHDSAGAAIRLNGQMPVAINGNEIVENAEYWKCPLKSVGDVRWASWDWEDTGHADATGTRVRFWFPTNRNRDADADSLDNAGAATGLCEVHELACFVEPQLENHTGRTQILANGMRVDDVRSIDHIGLYNWIGSRIWIDLRGELAPRLTVNRSKALSAGDAWRESLDRLFDRMRNTLPKHMSAKQFQNLSSLFVLPPKISIPIAERCTSAQLDFCGLCATSWGASGRDAFEFQTQRYIQALSGRMNKKHAIESPTNQRGLLKQYPLKPFQRILAAKCVSNFTSPIYRVIEKTMTTQQYFALVMERPSENKRLTEAIAKDLGIDLPQIESLKEKLNPTSPKQNRDDVDYRTLDPELRPFLAASLLQESLQPRLSEAWAPFRTLSVDGRLADSELLAPGTVQIQINDDGQTIRFADPYGESPLQLVQRGYDLTFPMTAVPLGQLRRECGAWRSDRWYRPLGVAPFLLPVLHDVWCEHAEFLQETFSVPHIYCLLPRFELWSKPFCDWTDADWHDPENLSALWDLSGLLTGTPGQVLWARGTHDIHDMPRIGLSAPEFLLKHSPKE